MSVQESDLLARYARTGDAEAFRCLVEEHQHMVFAACKRVLSNAADAEDAAQNCFLQLARKARTLRAPIAGWLHHVAVQVSIDMLRNRQSRHAVEARAANDHTTAEAPTMQEIQAVVDEALASLPEKLRVPIILHYLEGRKQEDIAAQLGITQSAVSKRLAQGVAHLQKRLKKGGAIIVSAALVSLLTASAAEAAPLTLTASLGRLSLAGATIGSKAAVAGATIGGISVLKLGIASVAVAGVLFVGGFAVHNVLSANPGPTQPTVAAQPAPIAPAVSAKEKIARVITGNVTLPDGKPAAGALVRLFYFHDASGFGSRWLSETRADEHGDFSIGQPVFKRPSLVIWEPVLKCYLVASHPQCGTTVMPVAENVSDGYSLTLTHACTLKCLVVDKDDRSAEGVQVKCSFLVPGLPWIWWPEDYSLWSGVTDAAGIVTFRDLPPGKRSVNAIGGTFSGRASVDLKAADGSDAKALTESTVKLDRESWTIPGQITFGDTGKSAPGMVVAVVDHVQVTEADGRFEATFRMPREVVLRSDRLERNAPMLLVYDPSDSPSYAGARLLARDVNPDKEAAIVMQRGHAVSGKVVDKNSGKPIPNAPVSLWIPLGVVQGGEVGDMLRRLTGADGRYEFRLTDDKSFAMIEGQIPGHVLVSDWRLGGAADATDFELDVRPEVIADILVRNPDGRPARSARVWLAQPSVYSRIPLPFETDAAGHVHMGQNAAGEQLLAYAISSDKKLAAIAAFPPMRSEARMSLELRLVAARTGKIVLRSEQGEALPPQGDVGVFVSHDDKWSPTIYWETCQGLVDGRQVYEVPGLLSGQEYRLQVTVQGYESLDAGGTRWRVPEQEQQPLLTLVLKRPNGAYAPPPPPRTEDDFKNDIAALKNIAWQKPDPVQARLTWYALKQGIAIADSEKYEVRRITELLGERDFVPSSIAFGKDKVWVGTNKGLFAWNRKDMFWTRFAVGGTIVNAPAKDLLLTDAGILKVTVEEQGKPRRAFEYDTQTAKWTDLK